ncbi:MAG TPA: helix-turn-helix transcriptional regulator [Verrucomicrobiae bacterium]|nr:helix-turn-helix transcriptional regulator [Verrucomicrobiae bacterium]
MAGNFATLLRNYRFAAGLSQEELAEAARISTGAVGAYERGVRQTPHRVTLDRLADALGLTEADRAHFMTSARRKLSRSQRPDDTGVVGLWRKLLDIQSDEHFSVTADAAIELLRAIDDPLELATCWTLLSERLERAGQRERARAARNCAQALSFENDISNIKSA